MKYGYFPGCSLLSSAEEYAKSSEAVLEALGVELEEIEDWVCCGATHAQAISHMLSLALPAISCAASEKQGLDVLTCCAACYSRLKQVNHELGNDPELREKVNKIIEEAYRADIRVVHTIEVLMRDIGLKVIAQHVKKPLQGLKVACYYGCMIARMPEELRIDKLEYPTMMDDLMRVVGAEPVDWPFKTECCGGGLTQARKKTVVRLSGEIIQMAKQSGADAIAVVCPLCQANLDMYQSDAEQQLGTQFGLPVLYFTQLMGLAMGLGSEKLCMGKLIVDPRPLLVEKGLVSGGVYL